MRYLALAADYDGTLATKGKVGPTTIAALRRLKESGRKLLMVTGRELPDLFSTFEHPELFDRIVAENGALLYNPATKEETVLAAETQQVAMQLIHRAVRFHFGPIQHTATEGCFGAGIRQLRAHFVGGEARELAEEFQSPFANQHIQFRLLIGEEQERRARGEFLSLKEHGRVRAQQ